MVDDKRVIFRIGVNLGDVIVEDDDILEDGINIANRIEALAEPGGMADSGQAHDDERDRLDLAFLDTHKQTLKNIICPVLVLRHGVDVHKSSDFTHASFHPAG